MVNVKPSDSQDKRNLETERQVTANAVLSYDVV